MQHQSARPARTVLGHGAYCARGQTYHQRNHVDVRDTVCSQCGACVALCPNKAIRLVPTTSGVAYPEVCEKQCNASCRLCRTVCGGNGIDWPAMYQWRFGTGHTHSAMSSIKETYTGHATSDAIRTNAASGGVVTALLCHGLRTGLFKGACVTFMDGLHPKTIVATTREEVMQAAGSVYLSAPALTVLSAARDMAGPLAFVGLPCHIVSLYKAVKCGAVKPDMFSVTIGLVCGRTGTLDLHRAFLQRMGENPARLRALKMRGDGWPGTFRYTMDDGTVRVYAFPNPTYMAMWKFYQYMPRYCLLCSDPLGCLADISVGDAWLPEFDKDRQGRCIIMVRTPAAHVLLTEASREGALTISAVARERVLVAQRQQIYSKSTNQRALRRVFGLVAALCHWPMPDDHGIGDLPHGTVRGYVYALFQIVNALCTEVLILRWIPRLMPLRTLSHLLRRRRTHVDDA